MKKRNNLFLSAVLLGVMASLWVPATGIAAISTVSFGAGSYVVNESGGSALISVNLSGTGYLADDFESYTDSAALQTAWSSEGSISSYILNTDSTKYMHISADLGTDPWYALVSKNLGGANLEGATSLTIDYRGISGVEKLQVEILNAANWNNKWQSPTWDYTADNTWHTQTIDISGCAWLNNVGPVRVVLKGQNWSTTTVDVDNLKFINSNPVTVSYATGDGTATSGTGNDYYATNGVLRFDPGITSQSFEVPIINDPFVESPETVILMLSNPVNATISGTNPVELTINDNDPVPASSRLEPASGCYVGIVPNDSDTIAAFCSRTGYYPAAFTQYFEFPSVADDFESYYNTKALKRVWTASTGLISSYSLNTSHTKYVEINANLGQSPYYDLLRRNYNGADWTGKRTLTIDYRGLSGRSPEKLEVEILDNANPSNKWQSGAWDYPNDSTWHTKTIDISGCAWLNNVGLVRVVVKGGTYGSTTVGIDNLRVGDWPAMAAFLDEVAAYGGMAVLVVDPRKGLDQLSQTDMNTFAKMCSDYNDLGVPILIRFGHEMNGDWYVPWSMKPDRYRTKFRAVANAVHSAAPLTAMAWTPTVAGKYPYGIYNNMTSSQYINGGYGTTADWTLLDTNGDGKLSDVIAEKDDPYSPFYPGDQYVDWVGVSCYHFGNAWPWGENEIPELRKLADQVTGNYNGANGDDRWNPDFYAEYAEAKGKPMMIAETGAWYDPNNPLGSAEEDIKLAWVEQVYNLSGLTANASDMAEFFPRIKLITWFNQIKQEGAYTCDWRISENLTVKTGWLGRLNTYKWGSRYFLDINDVP
jgi:hypothetical protein